MWHRCCHSALLLFGGYFVMTQKQSFIGRPQYNLWLKFTWSKEGSSVHGFLKNQLISPRTSFGRMKKYLFSTQGQIEITTVCGARKSLMTSFRPMIVTVRRSWFCGNCERSNSHRARLWQVSAGKWSLLSRASKRGGMASTQIRGHEERLLVDAKWRPFSLHQFGKGFSY